MTTKEVARAPPIIYAITKENTSIRGALTAMRMSIIYAICTFVTSVVILVTREDVENLSMLEKE